MLLAFAEHASIALTDARIVDESIHRALHDPLTGLPNRALFMDRLDGALARAERRGSLVGVLFLDLDRFKKVNDSLGHAAGDALLAAAADRLTGCLRPGDTVARFGGDEFAILLEDPVDSEASVRIAQRVLAAVREHFMVAGRRIFVDASAGIALGGQRGADLIRDADLAMYKAKGAGRGRHEIFERGMHAEVLERVQLEEDLRGAAERQELELEYQPIVRLATGEVVTMEALLRWRHPARGLLQPAEFIPLAEETGLVVTLGRWVVAEACRRAAAWRGSSTGMPIAVNVSGAQLAQPGLVEEVGAVLRETGLPPESLTLEITESVVMQDTEATLERLQTLKRAGVRLAVDDFGTGYSSLRYLRRFPIDTLKIDKVFVEDLGKSGEEPALAQAIIELGRNFGMQVVAEGVETADQVERLLALGCAYGQGFHFAGPTDPERLPALLTGLPRQSLGA